MLRCLYGEGGAGKGEVMNMTPEEIDRLGEELKTLSEFLEVTKAE